MAFFICPKCAAEDRLFQVQHNAEIHSLVSIVGKQISYASPEIKRTHGTMEKYHCADCGYELPRVESFADLIDYIADPTAFESED